jgi:hypothetical protein
VAEAQLSTGHLKRTLELRAAVGKHPAHPAGALEVSHDDLAQEGGGGCGVVGCRAASPYEVAASQAVICQTLPTPLRLPM